MSKLPLKPRILVIGEKLRFLFSSITRDGGNAAFLDEGAYDMRFVHHYLTRFDLIIAPYRFCVLHLSVERNRLGKGAYLVLETGANSHLDVVGVCDQVGLFSLDIVNFPPQGYEQHTISEDSRRRAFVEFAAYVARDAHGYTPPWDRIPKIANFKRPPSADEMAEITRLIAEATAACFKDAWQYYLKKLERIRVYYNIMDVKPIFPIVQYEPAERLKTCFMIMSFDENLTKVYEDLIRPVVQQCGIDIARADDFFTVGHIMEDVWRRINSADFVIADLTDRNPNVFYELGIAHTLGKPVIMLTQRLEDVPFDVRHQRVIIYGTKYSEVEALRDALAKSIESLRVEFRKLTGIQYCPGGTSE